MVLLSEQRRQRDGRKAFEGAIQKWREDQRVFGPDVVEAAFGGGGGRAPQADAARHSRAVHPGAATGVMTCRIVTDNRDANRGKLAGPMVRRLAAGGEASLSRREAGVRFALDSSVEGARFEPSVPRLESRRPERG